LSFKLIQIKALILEQFFLAADFSLAFFSLAHADALLSLSLSLSLSSFLKASLPFTFFSSFFSLSN